MIEETKELYEQSKKSLDTLLREKSYSEVEEKLKEKGIDIDDVSDEDIETLVAQSVKDMKNSLKGIGTGILLTTALSSIFGA